MDPPNEKVLFQWRHSANSQKGSQVFKSLESVKPKEQRKHKVPAFSPLPGL